jgi:hypothetical protein
MGKMTIKKALREKNKLVKRINEVKKIIVQCNQTNEENNFKYDTRALLEELHRLKEELVTLKTSLSFSVASKRHLIYWLSEYKDLLDMLEKVPTDEGVAPVSTYSEQTMRVKSNLKQIDLDDLKRETEEKIESIQDELDVFNATKELEKF